MKAARTLLIGAILGALIGWFLGYLRLPDLETNPSFLMGFIACISLVLLVFAVSIAWNKDVNLLQLIGKKSSNRDSTTVTRTRGITWILVAVCILGGGLLSSFLIYNQGRFYKTQMVNRDRKIREQSALIESISKSNMVALMTNILDHAEEELKNAGTLSDDIIAKIAALSFSFKPYNYLEGDSLSSKELSPERGQLLMNLLLMKMDSGSFARIKQRTSFAGADLRRANLKNADLRGANLSGADLKDTELSDANLSTANLEDANLWGANLNDANVSGADLKRSDLRWAVMNGTDLKFAVMDGVQMSGAQLIKADARKASIQWSNLDEALLNETNLAGANFLGAGMRKINLNKADLTRADLRMIHLDDATLLGTELNRALVDSNWIDELHEWRPTGSKEIQDGYSIITDTLDQWKHHIYRLRKIEK